MSEPGKERYDYDGDEVLRQRDDRHARRARDLAYEGLFSEARRQASKIEHYPRNDDLLDEIRDLKRSRARADGGEPQETGTELRDPDELLAVDYITVDELRRLHPTAIPLPPEHELDDAECHNCGEPWNGGEDWREQHLCGGASPGETWKYSCPNCGFQTFEVGT